MGSRDSKHIYLSPEAARLVLEVDVFDVFMEHSLVQVSLAVPSQQVTFNCWPLPSEILWQSVDHETWEPVDFPSFQPGTSATAWLSDFARVYEDGHVKKERQA